jgi:predicted LPLAT superfamily acyltransferase
LEKNNSPWKGVTGGRKWGQKGLLLLFRFVPRGMLYGILACVVPFYMLFSRKGYLSIYRYFRRRFAFSPFRSFLKTFHNHFVFGQCLLDKFAVYAGRNDFKIVFTGYDEYIRLINSDKGFIIASAHVGNLELGGYLLFHGNKSAHTLVFSGEGGELMKNRAKAMARNNLFMIPLSNDLSHVFVIKDVLARGNIVSVLCDRNMSNMKHSEYTFLGEQADFPMGIFTLAAQWNVPVLSMFVVKESFRRYHAYMQPVVADTQGKRTEVVDSYIKAFIRQLENIVRMYPEQWFNFYAFWKEKESLPSDKK